MLRERERWQKGDGRKDKDGGRTKVRWRRQIDKNIRD